MFDEDYGWDESFNDPGMEDAGAFSDAPPSPVVGSDVMERIQYPVQQGVGDSIDERDQAELAAASSGAVYTSANTISPPSEASAAGSNGKPTWFGAFMSDFTKAVGQGVKTASPDVVRKLIRQATGSAQQNRAASTIRLNQSGLSLGNSTTTLLLLGGGLYWLSKKA